MEDGHEVIPSHSGGSVKDSGTIGPGAWHLKGCSPSHPHRDRPGTRALPGVRVELLYTLRCLPPSGQTLGAGNTPQTRQ